MDGTEAVACRLCGRETPRAEMFGAAPDLVCPECADRVRERYERRLAPLRRQRPPVVTAAVVAIAGLLYVAEHVMKAGWVHWLHANTPVWYGQVWRLVTAAFLHAPPAFGLLHVGMNCLALWQLGRWIEGTWGPWAMAGLVLGGAVAASAAAWSVEGPAVGLSGVVFALAGFLFPLRKVNATAAAVMNPTTVNQLLTWFVLCIILTQTGTLAISNWGHGGGLVWGLLVGLAVRHGLRAVWVPCLALLTIGMLFATPHVAFGDRAERRAFVFRTWPTLQDWERSDRSSRR